MTQFDQAQVDNDVVKDLTLISGGVTKLCVWCQFNRRSGVLAIGSCSFLRI